MGTIIISDIELHAKHGAYHSEKKIRQKFLVSIQLKCDFEEAARFDDLNKTINYERIIEIVREIFQHPRSILESLVVEIAQSIKNEFTQVYDLEIRIEKPEVQLGLKVKGVSIIHQLKS